MTAEQLDLLADLEQEQADTAEQERRRAGDFTWAIDHYAVISCLFCRRTETVWLLRNNCGWDSIRTRRDRQCMSQSLTSSHVRYAAKHHPERLPEYIERARARQVGVDVDAILTEVEQDTR